MSMGVIDIGTILGLAPVIPVLVIDDATHARALAETLVDGGLPVLEVTLRTPAALDAIREMSAVAGAVIGAGTVLREAQLEEALEAGARFIVSPGLTEPLARAAAACAIPYLPGVATPSDLMRGLDEGLQHFKFFPAAANGGIPALRALCGPFGSVRFCPTGGITLETAPAWLALPQVACVGGSWLAASSSLVGIAANARAAAALARSG